jgi:PAS domain S-box-containing protein
VCQAPTADQGPHSLAPAQPLVLPGSAHFIQFYESDTFLVDAIARFIGEGLTTGDAGVIIATSPHRDAVEHELRARGKDPDAARAEGRYLAVDAAETMGQILVDTWPDPARFEEVVAAALGRVAPRGPDGRVRVFGEMVALLCDERRVDAAMRLESLWNALAHRQPFALLCAYPIGVFRHPDMEASFRQICAEHASIVPAESYPARADSDERLRAVVDLQRRALLREVSVEEQRRAAVAQDRLAAIVESSDDGIIGKTLDGVVTSWNRGAERIFGYTAEEMVGTPIARLVPEDRIKDQVSILDTVRRGGIVDHLETERMCKDGRRIHVALTISPIHDADGLIAGVSEIARDVTERKHADAERERLLAEAERSRQEAVAANRAKDEFLAMLSHELRNPLSAVRNAIVSARLDQGRRERALDIARRQTEQLARLVDDLLDISRITHGRIVLRNEPLYLTEVIERAVEATRSLIDDRGHTLRVSLPPDDVQVEGDLTRLEQVVVNLLGNSAKYTERGGQIDLVLERDGSAAVLRVRDKGIGIAPDMLGRVFELFAQSQRGLDRSQGGLGIGLTLVRSLVGLHGGTVEARSDGIGRGSEFVVRLPALAPAAAPLPVARRSADRVDAGRARILIVEDNVDAAESLAMLLDLLGHQVRVAHDGLAALELVTKRVPDFMLVDIGLPGMDGYEIARRIRRQPALQHVVLVALTGYGRDEDRVAARAAGFDHHLVKPIEPDALQALFARLRAKSAGASAPSLH